jgi:uncharacterized membrane protein
MNLRRALFLDRLRGSLFFVPSACVFGAVVLAFVTVWIDDTVMPPAEDLPFLVASTVDSARAILGTIATATITVAGIAFSVSLLVVQLASSQYSPRVVHNLFRDPTNKRVMGVVVGTFTYCLVVLLTVRSPVADNGESVVPNLSVFVAVVLGVGSILAIIAFINHNAHAMEVSEILQNVTDDALDAAQGTWPLPDEAAPPLPEPQLDGDGWVVSATSNGWVQDLDLDALVAVPEPGGMIRLETEIGRYSVAGAPLARLWPPPPDTELAEALVRRAVGLGRTRTLAQDPAYGVRQLTDVGIRALSAGVDDPTTAQDAIFHLAAVLRELHRRVPPSRVVPGDDDRVLVRPEALTHAQLIDLAFDELRRSAAMHPAVSIYLLEAMHLLCRSTDPPAPEEAQEAIRAQALLVVESTRGADLVDHDVEQVVLAYAARFGD